MKKSRFIQRKGVDGLSVHLVFYRGNFFSGFKTAYGSYNNIHRAIKNKVSIEEKFYDYADALTPYGVAVRYPNELFLEERHESAKRAERYGTILLDLL